MKIVFYIMLLAAGMIVPVQAQREASREVYRGEVSVKQNKAEYVNKKLVLDFDISLCGLSIGRYQSLVLMPMLRFEKDSLIMPPVIVNGANKQKMYERAVELKGEEEAREAAYAIVKNDPEYIQVVSYKKTLPYRPWMSRAELVLIGELENYQGEAIQTFINVLTKNLDLEMKKQPAAPKAARPAAATNSESDAFGGRLRFE